MAEKPNEEANFQLSQLAREEDLQKLVGDDGNRPRYGGKQFVFVERNPLSLALAQLISEHLY